MRLTTVVAVYSIVGGGQAAATIATFTLSVPLTLQNTQTPSYAGGYVLFSVVIVLLAWVYGLLAGSVQFALLSLARLALDRAPYRVRSVVTIVAGAALALAAGALARFIVFGDQVTPWWLVALIALADAVGLIVISVVGGHYRVESGRDGRLPAPPAPATAK